MKGMWTRQLLVTMKAGFGIYAPIYIVSTLALRRKRLALRDITHRMVPDILRSSLFLGVFGAAFFFCICAFRNIRQKDFKLNYLISGFLGSMVCISVEKKARRAELTTYMMNQAMESAFRVAEHYGLVKARKNGEVFLFMIANAIIMYMYQVERDTLRGSALGLLKMIFGSS